MIASKQLIQAAAGAGGESFWILRIGSTYRDRARSIAVDSQNNVIVVGFLETASQGSEAWIAKISPDGNVLWQQTHGGSDNDYYECVAVDSNDNIYVGGRNDSISGGPNAWAVKYNSSGTIQWQKNWKSNYTAYFYHVVVDSNDDIYFGGLEQQTSQYPVVVKYNSSGVLQANKRTIPSGATGNIERMAVGPNSLYTIGDVQPNYSNQFINSFYKSNLNSRSRKTYGTSSYHDRGTGIAVDSNENVFTFGNYVHNSPFGTYALIAKHSYSFLTQTAKVTLDDFGTGTGRILIDSSDNVIALNSTGFIVFDNNLSTPAIAQRQFTNFGIYDGCLDADDNIYITGLTTASTSGSQGNWDMIIAKLPADYSGTGTYTETTYSVVTPETPVSTTVTTGGTSISQSAVSMTESTTALAVTSSSLGSTKETVK